MYEYIAYCIDIFLVVMEIFVLIYLFQSIVYLGESIWNMAYFLVAPMLRPVQKMVCHSVMFTFSTDLSPYVLLILLCFLRNLCGYVLNYYG